VLFLLPQVLANGDDEHHGMWGDMWHDLWGGAMWIWLLVLAGLVVLALVFFLVLQSQQTRGVTQKRDELQVAKERLAKGEITAEAFDEIKKRLE
jgi:putative membrane protein